MEDQTADITQLDSLGEVDQIDWDTYDPNANAGKATGGGFTIPPEGLIVTGLVADAVKIGKTQAGKLKIEAGPVMIQDEPYGNARVLFADFSAKRYSNRNSSQALEFLAAVGVAAQPKTSEEYAELAKATAGRPFRFTVRWVGKCKECSTEIEGMNNFPQNADGTHQSRTKCVNGCEKPVFANLKIRSLISAL